MTLEQCKANFNLLKIEALLSVLLLATLLSSGTVATQVAAAGGLSSCLLDDAATQDGEFTPTIMHYTPETLQAALEVERTGQRASLDPSIVIAAAAHFDLLPHLQYIPAERDQG